MMQDMLQNGHVVAGRYEIRSHLGAGGMANVYLAWDVTLHREIALKTIRLDRIGDAHSSDVLRGRLMREARAAAQLNHPGIVVIHDLGETGGMPYISMEYIPGFNLRAFLSRSTGLTLKQTLKLASMVADALDYAHRRNVVHRDVKPENIMVTDELRPKITDFGIARIQSADYATLTTDGKLVCTYHYTAPEYFQGLKGDYRGDIFSFGCVLYELLTGRFAFDGETEPQVWWKIMHTDPEPVSGLNPNLPSGVDSIISSMLDKNPQARPASCLESVSRLTELLRSMPSESILISKSAEAENTGIVKTDLTQVDNAEAVRMLESTRTLRRKSRWNRYVFLAIGIGAGVLAAVMLILSDYGRDPSATAVIQPGPSPAAAIAETRTPAPAPTQIPVVSADPAAAHPMTTPYSRTPPTLPTHSPVPVPVKKSPATAQIETQPASREAVTAPSRTAIPGRKTPAPSVQDAPPKEKTNTPSPSPVPMETDTPITSIPPSKPSGVEYRFQHLPPVSVSRNRDFTVRVIMEPETGIESAAVLTVPEAGNQSGQYRLKKSDGGYEGTIPKKDFGKKRLSYYIEITCKDGTKIRSGMFEMELTDIWVPF